MDWLHLTLPATPLLLAHIAGGSAAVVSGFLAIFARKGAFVHRAAGSLFFVAMLVMAVTAIALGNIAGGGSTIYMASTAWVTVRRQEKAAGLFELAAAALAGLSGAWTVAIAILAMNGRPELLKDAFPVVVLIFGGVLLLAAALDLSVYFRRGLEGAERIARHLWRMIFALFIAVGSFAAQGAKVLPEFPGRTSVLVGAALLVLVLLVFWLVRVLFTGWYKANWGVKG